MLIYTTNFIKQKIIKHPDAYSNKFLKSRYRHNVWVKNTVMGIFNEVYSFRWNVLRDKNVVRDTKCRTGQYFIQLLWGADWVHNQNICLLDWVCRLIRKYKLPFSFKAATPCSLNVSKNVIGAIIKTSTLFIWNF